MSSCVAKGAAMAKSVSQTMEDLRQELNQVRQRVEHLRTEGEFPSLYILERWIKDAEAVLARWDHGSENPT